MILFRITCNGPLIACVFVLTVVVLNILGELRDGPRLEVVYFGDVVGTDDVGYVFSDNSDVHLLHFLCLIL